jgi:hypothetical protein
MAFEITKNGNKIIDHFKKYVNFIWVVKTMLCQLLNDRVKVQNNKKQWEFDVSLKNDIKLAELQLKLFWPIQIIDEISFTCQKTSLT